MGKAATNISIILGIVTIVFAGYYLYIQNNSPISEFATSEETRKNMLNNTRVFIEYRETLSTIKMDTSFFNDPRLKTFRGFTTEIEESTVGREDPFAEVSARANVSS